ncbi:Hypothetical protein NTJ_14271 [Nesidiocoris tenuis]|uniref:Uncharacterized protein n=1 Tax=Nesidiocoris tenuis TaxID=355587 RepID=A0ABN7BAN6_9HEMI|nr:Hypothetical protein NTJ_14271 [Nesidiocoris tenuis]
MEDDWADVRKRATERKAEHVKRLKASAVFSLEVYVSDVALDTAQNDSNLRIRYKFSDFACVEIPSRCEAEKKKDESECTSSPATSSPTTTTVTPTAEASKATSKENVMEELPKTEDAPPVSESDFPSSTSLSKPLQPKYFYRINSQMRNDPRYFEPRKLLRLPSQSLPTDDAAIETENDLQEDEEQENLGTPEKAPNDKSEAPESQPESPVSASFGEFEESEEYEDSQNGPASFDNGKSLIFCMEPMTLIRDLIQRPLCLIVLSKQEVLGIAKIGLQSLTDAIDKSIVLTKSIPLSGITGDTVDIKSRGRKLGNVNVEVRLTCFGTTVHHRIYVKGNPNDEQMKDLPKAHRSPSQRLIVVQMNANKIPLYKSKSKPTLAKSYPLLQGNVQRDISEFPPFVCGDEHLPEVIAKPERELTIVEKENMDKASARMAELTTFPQYDCIGDWEIVFARNVIKELIAKNRRPFQKGSQDRIYVEEHFPELLPGESKKCEKGVKTRQPARKTQKRDQEHTFGTLPLDKAWLKEGEIHRIRRRSVRPQVRTSASPAPSSVMTFGGGRPHTMTSMSHVAVDRFNMEKGDFDQDCEVSRILPHFGGASASTTAVSDKSGPRGLHRKRTDHHAEADIGPRLFDVKHPRIDQSLEKFNPIPEHPLTVEIDAPERAPADKFVQAIRTMNKDVDNIGCDVVLSPPLGTSGGLSQGSYRNLFIQEKTSISRLQDSDASDTFLVQVGRGVPILVPARSTPYWEGHVPACNDPVNCRHFVILHPGYGFYGR